MLEVRAPRGAALVICAAAVGWLCLGFLVGVQPDEEEYRHTIPSTMVAADAFQRGELAFWTSDIGLGVPQPYGHSLSLHPLTPLLGVLPVVLWVKLFYVLHLAPATAGMWLLARRVGASPLARSCAVATYILAAPALNYALRDFWPSAWLVYTMMPLVVLGMLALCEEQSSAARLRASLGLGLAAGIVGATGHQGYLVVFIPACLAFLLPHRHAIGRAWGWWLLATAIALVLAAPIIVHLSAELSLSTTVLDRQQHTDTMTWDGLWDVFARPFTPATEPGFDWRRTTFQRGVRVFAFGGPAAVLALLFATVIRSRWDLVLGILVPLVPMTVPGLLESKFFSALYLFRDPSILFASLAAALALDWLATRPWGGRRLAHSLLAAQLVVLGLSAWPFINYNLAMRAKPVTDVFVGEQPVSSWLRDHVRGSGGRVYYTAAVDRLVMAEQLMFDGLWRNSMFYRGVPVINSLVTFVAIDPLAPNGQIRGSTEVSGGDTTLLDIAGARWVLALADEAVSPTLVRRAGKTSRGGHQLVLYELPSARGAVFVDPSLRGMTLPVIDTCDHDRLLCRDFTRLAPVVSPAVPRVDRAAGRIAIDFDAEPRERLLLVGEMYRPGWQVDVEGASVEPLLGGLVGVRVPPQTASVTLRFRPAVRVALTRAAWTTMGITAVALAAAFARRGRSPR